MDKISLERLDSMHPKVKDELICAYNYINSKILGKGVRLRITHTLRTAEEQHKLFIQRPKITNADSWQSIHNYGLAFDIVILLDKDGDGKFEESSYDQLADNDKNGKKDWDEVVTYLKSLGWSWGGDFKKFPDSPHFEKTSNLSWRQMKSKYDKGDTIIENGKKYIKL